MVDKIASWAAKMQNDAIGDRTLPIVAVIDKSEKYKVHVRTALSKDLLDGVNVGIFLEGLKALSAWLSTGFWATLQLAKPKRTIFMSFFANNSLLWLRWILTRTPSPPPPPPPPP